MKVGRSIINVIGQTHQARTQAVSVDLEQLSDSIKNIATQLATSEPPVDQIVSYQADQVYNKDLEIPDVVIPQILDEKVAIVKSKVKTSLLKKLLSKKSTAL